MSTPNMSSSRAARAADLKERIRNAERPTLPFRLIHTGDIEVQVQRPSLTFLMQTNQVPSMFRRMVDDQIRKFGKAAAAKGVDMSKIDLDALVGEYGADVLSWETDLVNATVVAGFVEPPVTLDRERADAPDSIYLHIDEIDYRDREAFYAWCNREQEADVDAVKSDARPAPAADAVGVVPDGEGLRVQTDRGSSLDLVGYNTRGFRVDTGPDATLQVGDDDTVPGGDAAAERLVMAARSSEI